jgi:hypothetical protein
MEALYIYKFSVKTLPDLKNTSTEVKDEKRKYLLEEIGRERFCSCIRHAFPCTQKGEREREKGAFFSGQKEE